MARPPSLRPTAHLHIKLDAELRKKMDTLLWSETEGRVPAGSHKQFIEQLLRAFFDEAWLKIGPGAVVTGDARAIEMLRDRLHFEQEMKEETE